MIAAFGDFHVGKMSRRQPKARRGEIRNVIGARSDIEQRSGDVRGRCAATTALGFAKFIPFRERLSSARRRCFADVRLQFGKLRY